MAEITYCTVADRMPCGGDRGHTPNRTINTIPGLDTLSDTLFGHPRIFADGAATVSGSVYRSHR